MKKIINLGLIQIEIIAIDGKGSIRTAEHKYTKEIYKMIKERQLANLKIGLQSNNKIEYSERLNCVIEYFPGKKEEEIMKIIEEDLKQKDSVVDTFKKKAEAQIKKAAEEK
jgi:hypothetical protein